MINHKYDKHLENLRSEHRQLDKAISILEMDSRKYYEAIIELKKRKLRIKDEIYLKERKYYGTENYQTHDG